MVGDEGFGDIGARLIWHSKKNGNGVDEENMGFGPEDIVKDTWIRKAEDGGRMAEAVLMERVAGRSRKSHRWMGGRSRKLAIDEPAGGGAYDVDAGDEKKWQRDELDARWPRRASLTL